MALTNEQSKEFDRMMNGLLSASIAGTDSVAQEALMLFVSASDTVRLSRFKVWARAERAREVQAEVDGDARVVQEKADRVTREGVLITIDSVSDL